MKIQLLFFATVILSLGVSLKAPAMQQPIRAEDARKFVEDYLTAFNGGEDSMGRFFEEHVSKDALAQRPIEARLSIYRQMRNNLSELTLEKTEEVNQSSITALMHTKKDEWRRFMFELEAGVPLKMIAIRVEDAEGPESVSLSPMTEKDALRLIGQFLRERTKSGEFSGTVLVAKNGKPVFTKAYGMASKEFGVRNRVDTKFNLGSINKIFTQVAIGQLIEEGELSLSDPIGKYLPEYPNKTAAEKVTIRHLIDMSSGIGDFFGEKFENTPKEKLRSIADYLPLFAGDSLEFEPGTKKQYSNGGYVVLGAIIEKVSGRKYYEYVREHIFNPTGMPNTESYEADDPVPNLAEGYTREGAKENRRKNIYTRPARGSSAGGGYSTVEDLQKFTIALEKNAFFKNPETWSVLRGEQPPGGRTKGAVHEAGLGIFGGAPGINSGIETGIGKGYMAIVMANYDPPAAADAMNKIKQILKSIK
jgi:D-alanyl-D-alanine carboxypeptidase